MNSLKFLKYKKIESYLEKSLNDRNEHLWNDSINKFDTVQIPKKMFYGNMYHHNSRNNDLSFSRKLTNIFIHSFTNSNWWFFVGFQKSVKNLNENSAEMTN